MYFTRRMPGLLWQPTDRYENLAALNARFAEQGNESILPPLKLDVILDPWPDYAFDAAFSANTAHIMSWDAVVSMFAGVASHLESNARFCLYGPFNVNNQFTSQSNADFDARLRAEDSNMGIRDMTAIEPLASQHQMPLEQKLPMPANNFILVFKKL